MKLDEKYKNKEFFYEEYINKNKSANQIAKEIKVSRPAVSFYLKRFGITKEQQITKYYQSYLGKKIGNWTIISVLDDKDKHKIVTCQHNEGQIKKINLYNLINRGTASYYIDKFPKTGKLPNHFVTRVCKRAQKVNMEFNLDHDYLWDLFLKQNKKCAFSGIEIIFTNPREGKQTASLDRIDSQKGYIKGNVQWVHKQLNRMKWNLDEKSFFQWIDMIYHFKHNAHFVNSFFEKNRSDRKT